MKYGLNKIILGLSLSVVFGVFFVTGVNAASTLTGVDTNVIAECKEKLQAAVAIQPKPLPNGDVDTSNVDKALEKASAECLESATTDAAKAQISQMIIQSTDEVARDVAKVARRAALAGAWKAMWSAFSQQLAYDTATWIASGGEGQQPLFVTEGWSAYLKNTADNAIGTFIDQIDSRLGYDLCEPDFNLKIPLIQSLDPRAPRKARCTFTKMMDNWQNAINNPNYTYEYVNFLQPGENDLSTFLILQTDINDEVDRKMSQAFLEAIVGQGWKDITDFTGKILTPGSTVRAWLENSPIVNQKMPENEVFTNTIYDFIETFLNTLVGKLLNKLQSGLFDDGNSSGSSLDINDINNLLQDANSRFASLLNPEAQPYFEGRQGAQTRMGDIIEGEITVGGPYEILNELTQCTNANNPGPSECVVDQIFAQKVREKTLIRDLPDSILNRKFVPPVDEVFNPQEAFTLRNIIILRKYRIVPVGWEIAARYLDERRDKSYSLGDLMRGFDNSDSPFYQLVDPYWVLKAPELFCRREGFGPLSSYFGANSQSVRRDTYCADEQQCLREDRDGNCIAYGYCTEEKRVWDFSGDKCDPKFNTCQTYQSRSGAVASYLSNSLDQRYCDSQSVGCRWYSAAYNPVSNDWMHANDNVNATTGLATPANQTILAVVNADTTITVAEEDGWRVAKWNQISANGRLVMNYTCTTEGGCLAEFVGKSCTIPKGGVQCRMEQTEDCLNDTDVLADYNGDFSSCSSWDADSWSEGYQSQDSRHSCVAGVGQSNNGFESFTVLNADSLTSRLSDITVLPGARYNLTFWVKNVNINNSGDSGTISVAVNFSDLAGNNYSYDASIVIADQINAWKKYQIEDIINPADNNKFEIVISTLPGASGQIYFDDFELNTYDDLCYASDVVWLNNGTTNGEDQEINFDRDVQACDSSAEGCKQFIRTKVGLGSNLIPNSGFEITDGDDMPSGWKTESGREINNRISRGIVHSGLNALELDVIPESDCDDLGEPNCERAYISDNFVPLETGKKYILSAWAYSTCPIFAFVMVGPHPEANVVTERIVNLGRRTNEWVRLSSIIKLDSDLDPDNVNTINQNLSRISISPDTSNECDSPKVYIDDFKLEEVMWNVNTPTIYTPYDPAGRPDVQVTSLKASNYYNCYDADLDNPGIDWPMTKADLSDVLQNRDSNCQNYSSVCIPDEVGCELYTPTNGNPAVPGTISSADLCPAECVGYESYYQEKTYFTTARYAQFIADSSPTYCSASYAGCDEFTNLDEVAKGGEGLEYYSQIQSCQKPAPDGPSDAANYYTWEGSDNTGYQLKAFKFKRSNVSASLSADAPCTVLSYDIYDNNQCVDQSADTTIGSNTISQIIDVSVGANPENSPTLINQDTADALHEYGLCLKQELHGFEFYFDNNTPDVISDDIYTYIRANPDCRELYDATGGIHYRLLSHTVSISENCLPFRRTQTQSLSVDAKNDCEDSSGFGNLYDECIYMAVPGEGRTCPAGAAGCRQYTGDQGNNVRNIFYSSFETGAEGWTDGTLSSETTHPGGQSLVNTNADGSTNELITHNVYVSSGKAYVLSFWAKGNVSFTLDSIKFNSASLPADFFASASSSVNITTDWKRYDLGPVFITWNVGYFDDTLAINIPNDQKLYIDSVLLQEVKQNVYLIENSWFVPYACDNKLGDTDGASAIAGNYCANHSLSIPNRCSPNEMLGCASYNDRAGSLWNLKSFEKLCRDDAVGCEALIYTQNNDTPFEKTYNPSAEASDAITVPADQLVYLVNDDQYQCALSDKGCNAYGLPQITKYDEVVGYDTVYFKNQPDRYETDLCSHNQLWCEEYSGSGSRSISYFKDPRGKLCEYHEDDGKWYQTGEDTPCETDAYQTIGLGDMEEKLQPIGWFDNKLGEVNDSYQGWAGLCPSYQSSCSEFIDPLSAVYNEWVFNGDFEASSNGTSPDGWDRINNDTDIGWTEINNSYRVKHARQDIDIYSHTLYTLSAVITDDAKLTINCNDEADAYITSPDGSMVSLDNDPNIYDISRVVSGETQVSGRFYLGSSLDAVACTLIVDSATDNAYIDDVKVVPTGVYYYLDNDKLDRTSCGGQVDLNNGCVLINDRAQLNLHDGDPDTRFSSYLRFDADATYNKNSQSPVIATVGSYQNNASSVIKVKPDRECYSWLSCTTYKKSDPNDLDNRFGVLDECLDIGLCIALRGKGECGRFAYYNLAEESLSELSTYDEGDKNKSGYSRLGKEFTDENISGYYPYHLMTQTGNAANVGNGNFGSVYTDSSPVGWTLFEDIDDQDWQPYKFSVEAESGLARGGSYLELKGIHQAVSEDIDVEGGVNYIVSGWINTLDLLPSDGPEGAGGIGARDDAIASILIQELTSGGTPIEDVGCNGAGGCTMVENSWQKWYNNLVMEANLPWHRVTKEILTNSRTATIRLRLSNHLASDSLDFLSGQTLFDDVDVKPVLIVGQNDSQVLEYLPRSCRTYPESNSLSCKYVKDGNLYYGWHGYCLTEDPSNPGNCLQWWPVDQIAGDTLDEFSTSYSDRMPLYYCTNTKTQWVPVVQRLGSSGAGNFVGEGLSMLGVLMPMLGGKEESAIDFMPFNSITPIDSIFFRSPNVKYFILFGSDIGVNFSGAIALSGFGGLMTESVSLVGGAQGGLGYTGTVVGVGGLYVPLPQYSFSSTLNNSLDSIETWVTDQLNIENGDIFDDNSVLSWFSDIRNSFFSSIRENILGGVFRNSNILDFDCGNVCDTSGCSDNSCSTDPNLLNILNGNCQNCCQNCAPESDSGYTNSPLLCAARCPQPFACLACKNTKNTVANLTSGEGIAEILSSFQSDFVGRIRIMIDGMLENKISNLFDLISGKLASFGDFTDAVTGSGWSWGFFTATAGGDEGFFTIGIPVGWNIVEKTAGASAAVPWQLFDAGGMPAALGGFGMKIITDEDEKYKDEFSDPHPDVKGDILGFAFINESQAWNSMMSNVMVATAFPVEYCSEVVQVVTPSGQNKAWNARAAQGSTYELIARDLAGDTLFESIVESIGNLDFLSGSLPFNINIWDVVNRMFPNIAGFLTGGLTDGKYGYHADYQPFGAMVPPADSVQYPPQWDSRTDAPDHQPLFDEQPRLNFDEPYQARLGTKHEIRDIKEIFAKSYGAWEWEGSYKSGEYQPIDSSSDISGAFLEILEMIRSTFIGSFIDGTVTELRRLAAGYAGNSDVLEFIDSIVAFLSSTEEPSISLRETIAGFISDGVLNTLLDDPNFSANSLLSELFSRYRWDVTSLPCIGGNAVSRQPHTVCYYPPTVSGIKTNNMVADDPDGGAVIGNKDSIRLSFNVHVDEEQLPLISYTVNWGDGTTSAVSGVSLRNRTHQDYPFDLYHQYDYWMILRNDSSNDSICCDSSASHCGLPGLPAGIGEGDDYCALDITIKARDNWGKFGEKTAQNAVFITK